MRPERHHLEGHQNRDHNISHIKRLRIRSHLEVTESIGDYILRTFYVFHCWSEFFNDEMPLHDAFSIKVLMGKVLMVFVDHNLLT
jgi:hypothetical protein